MRGIYKRNAYIGAHPLNEAFPPALPGTPTLPILERAFFHTSGEIEHGAGHNLWLPLQTQRRCETVIDEGPGHLDQLFHSLGVTCCS